MEARDDAVDGLWHAAAVPTTLSFAPTIPALLHGSRAVLVVAAAGVLTGEFPAFLPAPAQALLAELARDTKPGELGAVSGTLTGLPEPRRLLLGVLPDQVMQLATFTGSFLR